MLCCKHIKSEILSPSHNKVFCPCIHIYYCMLFTQHHFEESQFETRRQDGWRKLKPNAIPTVFDVPNCPKKLEGRRRAPRQRGSIEGSNGGGEHCMPVDTPAEESCATTMNGSSNDGSSRKALEEQVKGLQQKVWRLEKELAAARKEIQGYKKFVGNIPFFGGEMGSVIAAGKRVLNWPPESIKQALQIRFAVGWKGYSFLLGKGLPLPTYSTLCRRLQAIDFQPGVLNAILPYLAVKCSAITNEREKDCVILMDEMEIASAIDYDISSSAYIGHETLGDGSELATQLLVVMIRGINTNWKQVVGYHLCSKKARDDSLYKFLLDCIVKVEGVGYKVRGVVSDMGPKNQSVWRSFEVRVGRYSLVNHCQHPVRSEHKLYFFADTPHLLKNLRSALLSHDITLPREVCQLYSLPDSVVSASYIRLLEEIQRKRALKLAPKLRETHLNPNQFEKMKVATAAQVISNTTASALETLVTLGYLSPKAKTTAWFLRTFRRWFDLMNSRELKGGLSKRNLTIIEEELKNILDLVEKMEIGPGRWKPIQTGITLSTLNVLEITKTLLQEKYKYVLTARFNQDCLENLFSILRRHGNTNPGPIMAIRALKLATLSQFVGSVSKSSYATDSAAFYVNMFSNQANPPGKTSGKESPEREVVGSCCHNPLLDSDSDTDLADRQTNDLDQVTVNKLCGCAISKAKSKGKICIGCLVLFQAPGSSSRIDETLTDASNMGGLVYPTADLFHRFQTVEKMFLWHMKRCQNHKYLLKHLQLRIKLKVHFGELAACEHGCIDNVVKQYLSLRLKIHVVKVKQEIKEKKTKNFSSRSAYRANI